MNDDATVRRRSEFLTVDVRLSRPGAPDGDENETQNVLLPQLDDAGFIAYPKGAGAGGGVGFSYHTLTVVLLPAIAYVGKKAVDVVADFAKDYLKRTSKDCRHRTVEIFGPNGEVVKVVECPDKHK